MVRSASCRRTTGGKTASGTGIAPSSSAADNYSTARRASGAVSPCFPHCCSPYQGSRHPGPKGFPSSRAKTGSPAGESH